MRYPLILLFIVGSLCANAQVRLQLPFTKRWLPTVPEQATYIRICYYDTINKVFSGPVVDLYRNGKTQMTGRYKLSHYDGDFVFYYDNGSVESQGKLESDVRVGVWKYFYQNGKPKQEVTFYRDKEPVVHFLNDSTGVPLLKDGSGKWIEEIEFLNGDKALVTGEYKNYQKNGTWTYAVANSGEIVEEEYNNGKYKRGFIRGKSGKQWINTPLTYSLLPGEKFTAIAQFNTLFKFTIDNAKDFQLPSPLKSEDEQIFTIVEESTGPPDGLTDFYKFLYGEFKYPSEARKMRIEGKVFVEFVVEQDGSLTNFVVVKSIGAGCDEEAMRVFELYAENHKWNPGRQNGKAVKQRMVLPLNCRPR